MKYYAVKVGRTPGIYKSWDECKKQVLGVKSIYKSFTTLKEAEAFIGEVKSDIKSDIILTQVYFDGSCKDGVAGGACLIGNKVYYQKVQGEGTNNRGELTGLILALSQSQGDVEILGDSMYAMNVASGYKSTKNIDLIDKIKALLKGRNIKWTHVDGHTGIEGNEICDRYANKARMMNDYITYLDNL